MLFSVFYLSLFLSVGLLSARRAVPDGSAAVIVPLGCGFGVSLLAVLPALFAVVLGFTLPAVALAAAAAEGIGAALLYRGTRLRGMAKDPDSGALWACLLPVVLITLYLLAARRRRDALSFAHPCAAHGGRRVPHGPELLRRYADAPRVHQIYRAER